MIYFCFILLLLFVICYLLFVVCCLLLQELQPLSVAKILNQIAKKVNPSLIIMGKQSIDSDANQTGQMLAGLLKWPQATFASKVQVSDDNKVCCKTNFLKKKRSSLICCVVHFIN